MEPQQSEVRSNDGHPIPVWTSGRGRPLLIVHGAAGTHVTWEMMRAHLDVHCTVAIMDRRATSGDPLSRLEMDRELEDVAAVAQWMGGDVAVLGHSSGALCTLGAAPLIPNLRHLLLYEPPLERGEQYPIALQKLQKVRRQGDIDAVYDVWLKEYAGAPATVAEGIKASPVGASMRPLAQYLPREMAAHLAWTFDLRVLRSVSARVVYLVGSQTPEENVQLRGFIELLEPVLKDFVVREIPGQGHFANLFAPELLARIILESIQT